MCVAGWGMHGRGACVAGGMRGGGMHGAGHVWPVGGVCGGGCVARPTVNRMTDRQEQKHYGR